MSICTTVIDSLCVNVKCTVVLGSHVDFVLTCKHGTKACIRSTLLLTLSDQHSRVSSKESLIHREASNLVSSSRRQPCLLQLQPLALPRPSRHRLSNRHQAHAPLLSKSSILMPYHIPCGRAATPTSRRPSRPRPVMLPMP